MHSSTNTPSTRVALTTAYREPTSCQNNFKTITTSGPGSSQVISILVSEPINSCYPSGSGYHFRDNKNHRLASPIVSNQCEQWTESKPGDDGSVTDTDRTTKAPDRTLLVYQASPTTWSTSESVTNSSNPHTLSNGQTMPRSGPPQLVKRGEPDSNPRWRPWINFLMIGIPIIVASILICCFGLCWWNRRKMRKRGQEIPLDSVPPHAGNENWSTRSRQHSS
ncbi:hypothetical protein BKA59DRAFT_528509 [Fusarium tricinctum]|uniref:Uncharacterized protein n=1 Tax=Fusarium tricinctum TaxID=61284 RepID=A0A8K0S078_9HYPO|nr:hypothetical protein BKA59DRAFT_528509 [Fusarium tricinctum]